MGQKANPNGLRLGIVKGWDCNWFDLKGYGDLVFEDFYIRNYLTKELHKAGVARICIYRKQGFVECKVFVSRAGIIFGKNGMDISFFKEELERYSKKQVRITIVEEKNADLNSKLIGEWVAAQLEKRIPFRRAMKMAITKAMKSGAKGIMIGCAGRLGGVEIARSEWYREGKVPLHTLRADIDYAFSEALTTFGKIGVKVWVYKGEQFNVQTEIHTFTRDTEVKASKK